jgi:hypothetical protein
LRSKAVIAKSDFIIGQSFGNFYQSVFVCANLEDELFKKILLSVILVFMFILMLGIGTNVSGQTVPTNFLYLPTIKRAVSPSIFGAEINFGAGSFTNAWPSAQSSGMYWIRKNGLQWSEVQPNNNTEWKWQNVTQLETEMALAGSAGNKTILIIRSTPGWAQKYPGYFCGPMREDKIADFTNFVKEAVKRYSASPYFVDHYEFWNEPDVDYKGMPGDSIFGCWGDQTDPYYGGGYYAQMLAQVYPAVKSVNSNAQVLIGGLLLYCDPTDPGPTSGCDTDDGKNAAKFFEGILKNNGGSFFDIVNFHGYPYRQSVNSNPILLEKDFLPWKSRGGVVKGKIDFLREVMATYGVNKPIFQSEAALMRSSDFPEFERNKADYLVWVFARNMTENLLGTTWYTLDGPGWNFSGLLDANQAPLPAYFAMKFAASKLGDAVYVATLNIPAGMEGFEFTKGGKKIWVVFRSGNATPPSLTLPGGYSAVYDTLGNPITPVGGKVTVDHPIYIDFAP